MKKRITSLFIVMVMIISFIPVWEVHSTTTSTTIEIGDYVQMGKYYDEPILWRCVDIDDNGPLMLSDKIITFKSFDAAGNHKYLDGTAQEDDSGDRAKYGSNLWQTSSIRSWLNSSESAGNITWLDGCPPTADKVWNGYNAYANEKGFLAEGNFTASEQNAIKTVTQKSLLNQLDLKLKEGGTDPHNYSKSIVTAVQNYDTAYYQMVTDKMFLLNVEQSNKVYQNSNALGTDYWIGTPTQKALDNSDYKYNVSEDGGKRHSWQSTPCSYSGYSMEVRFVEANGNVSHGGNAYGGIVGARPAFYINLSSVIFKSGNGSTETPYITANGLPEQDIAVTGITSTTTSSAIKVGQSLELTAQVEPTNATDKSIIWSVVSQSVSNVISLSAEGVITATNPGTAVVRATSNMDTTKYVDYNIEVSILNGDTNLDLNKDGVIDRKDLAVLKANILSNSNNTICDINNDNKVNIIDYILYLRYL